MASVFPTSSHKVREVDRWFYDIDQLSATYDSALRQPSAKASSPPLPSSSLLHVHDFTLTTTLQPPGEAFVRWGGNEANPEYQAFDAFRARICSDLDPLIPRDLPSSTVQPLLFAPPPPRFGGLKHIQPELGFFLVDPVANVRHYRPLFSLPDISDQSSWEWYPNSTAKDNRHWLNAVIALDPMATPSRKKGYRDDVRRIVTEPKMQVLWSPSEVDGEVDIQLVLSVKVYFDMNKLFLPLPPVGADLLGFILHSLIPHAPSESPYLSEAESRTTALKHFYDCLRPAPDHPLTFNVTSLQPKEMTCQLLPFQKRTLAELLKRERSPMVAAESSEVNPKHQWSGHRLGKDLNMVAYRRLTGDLVSLNVDRKGKGKASGEESEEDGLSRETIRGLPVLVDLKNVRGTMLCEEMGLGKTVEAISLVLLHRHPLSTRSLLEDVDVKPASAKNPVMDLYRGIPDLDDVQEWLQGEKQAFEGQTTYDETAQLSVADVAATLVVTPPVLLKQWVSEMRRHCPSLRVCVYEGWQSLQKGVQRKQTAANKEYNASIQKRARRMTEKTAQRAVSKYRRLNRGAKGKSDPWNDSGSEDEPELEKQSALAVCQREFLEYVLGHDVVITTYNDLSADLKVAQPAPARSRRSNADYRPGDRPRSPLVMVEWWRVIMDEVQLCGDSSQAAEMVSLIPRRNSLAVSGTPARTDIKDLIGSLKFLRVPVLPYNTALWHRFQQAPMRDAFAGLFQKLAIRTTKQQVSGEFHLPSQSRLVVPVELSEIELHYYNDTLDRQRDILRILADGTPSIANWYFDRQVFRECLITLRQICTHIQVGQMQGLRGERRMRLGNKLMTMSEALERMKSDHAQELLVESRAQLRLMILKAQLIVLDDRVVERHRNALAIYEKVREKVNQQLGPLREHLKTLTGGSDADEIIDVDMSPTRQLTQQEKEKGTEITTTRVSIRELRIIEHQSWFFQGDAHHVLKDTGKETDSYTRADSVRKEILVRPLQIANMSVTDLEKTMQKSQPIESVAELHGPSKEIKSGLHSRSAIEPANELIKILNGNAELIFHWRTKIIELLSKPIDAEQKDNAAESTDVVDPENEYYAEALRLQGEVEAFLIAYAAALADRKEFLSEDRATVLAEYDGRVKMARNTKRALNALADAADLKLDDTMLEQRAEVHEQAEQMLKERQALRDARKHPDRDCELPLKSYLFHLNPIIHGEGRYEEVVIAQMAAETLRTYIDGQMEYVSELQDELDLFRKTFNRRIVYFAALQDISDSVTAPEFKDLKKEIDDTSTKIIHLEVKLARLAVKGRFLEHLGARDQGDDELKEDCIICFGSSEDKQAALLECGHFFCISCYKEYRRSVQGTRCPQCREIIDEKATRKIKLVGSSDEKPDEVVVEAVQQDAADGAAKGPDEPLEGAKSTSPQEIERLRREQDMQRLKTLDVEQCRQIARIDMLGDYGSKINFLIKHLLWYQMKDRDARHVIFSNWSDSIKIVTQALRVNGIKFSSFDQKSKAKDVVDHFINDTSISVFLLHAERESSGLTLTSCRVVHLLEPILKHSFELQAIGRVDRLGQEKETTVYCYATMDTVESRILAQGVRNGTSIYLKDKDADMVMASLPNVASAAHKGGDVSSEGDEEILLSLIT